MCAVWSRGVWDYFGRQSQMAYTTQQLVDIYTRANAGAAPSAATRLTLDAYAQQTLPGGGLSEQAALNQTLTLVNGTTAVAVATYQFFNGAAPSAAGLTYLLNSATNANDLNDATGVYGSFNQDSRFINFSINLALAGTSASTFAAAYGQPVTFRETVASAYDKIIGNAVATAAGNNVTDAVNWFSRQANIDALTGFVRANNPTFTAAQIDLAVKAAVIGQILSTAVNTGLGIYASATRAAITDLSDDGVITGNTDAGLNIITAFPGTTPSVNASLTTGVDTFVGTAGNDVIAALIGAGTPDTLTVADSIDGGAGNDTLNITAVAAFTGLPVGAKISNVETVNITGVAAVTANSTAWTGTTALNVSSVGAATLTSGATTAVSVTSEQGAAAAVSVTGGSTVKAQLNIADGVTAGAVTISGTASSVSVTETATGATASGLGGTVAISDSGISATKAGTLASVTLSGTGAATIASNALANLSLSNTGTVGITNSLTTPVNTALALTASGTVGAITNTSNDIKTLNVSAGAAAATIANFTGTGVTALNVSGTKAVTFTAISTTNLETVTVAGSAGLTADFSAIAKVTSVSTAGTTGASTIGLDGTKATFTGGAGDDTVVITAAPTKSLTGGAGTDTLVANIAGGFDASANGKATGFEVLGVAGTSTGTFNASGFTGLSVLANVGGATTFSNVAAGTALTYLAGATGAVNYNLADSSGTADAATVNLKSAAGITVTNLTLTGVENVTVNSTDTNTTAHVNTLSLLGNDSKSLTITGNTGLILTAASTKLATVDAHALTGAFTFTTGVTTGTTTITGSATAVNTITGGSAADTIVGGSKADVITSGTGLDILTGGAGSDTFVLSANANGNTYATITDFTKTVGTVAGDIIDASAFVQNGALNTSFVTADKISLADTAAFADYLNAAAAGDGSTNSHATWFNYAGNTYIVVDNSADGTFISGAAADQVVKLTGVLDLSTVTITAGGVFTYAA